MEDRQRVAIGTVVMRNTQYLAAVRPLDGVLAMSTMRFADEIVPRGDVDGLPSRRTKPDTKAMKMATMLVDSLEADWDPERYHDTFTEELRERIVAKGSGKKIASEEAEAPKAEGLDLMAGSSAASSPRGRRSNRPSRHGPARAAERVATPRPWLPVRYRFRRGQTLRMGSSWRSPFLRGTR